MSNEEFEKKAEFIVEKQAQFASKIVPGSALACALAFRSRRRMLRRTSNSP
jgi:hypothetical protein